MTATSFTPGCCCRTWSISTLYDVEDYGEVANRIVDIALNGLAATGHEWTPTPISSKSLLGDRKRPPAQEAFLVAATQLLNEQCYRGASIDKIASRLDMTKGSFYHYHETKDAFLVECFRRTYDVMANGLRAAGRLQRPGLDKLATVCAAIGRFQLSDGGPLLINSAISALPHSLAAEMLKDWNGVTERFAFLISGGMVDGSIRVVDARIAAQMLNAAVNSTAQLALWTDVDELDDAARYYLEPLFSGYWPHRRGLKGIAIHHPIEAAPPAES